MDQEIFKGALHGC